MLILSVYFVSGISISETTLSLGVFNNTYYNVSGFVQLNLSLSANGTYTGIVKNFTSIPQSEGNTINVTTETTLPTGTNINVSLRTFFLNDNSVVGLWMEKAEGTNWKNYGSGGSILDGTVPANNIVWSDETYNKSYGVTGSYLFSPNPNPGIKLLSEPDASPLDITQNFTVCIWMNLTDSSHIYYAADTSTGFRLECDGGGGGYYMYARNLTDEVWVSNINGNHCANSEWTFMCYGYNSSHFWRYRDGTFLAGDATTGTVGNYNSNIHIGLYADGYIAMLAVINETKDKNWLDEAYAKTKLSWQPYSTPCDISINTTGCLFNRTTNFIQPKFIFQTENISSTSILYNYTYTLQNVSVDIIQELYTFFIRHNINTSPNTYLERYTNNKWNNTIGKSLFMRYSK